MGAIVADITHIMTKMRKRQMSEFIKGADDIERIVNFLEDNLSTATIAAAASWLGTKIGQKVIDKASVIRMIDDLQKIEEDYESPS